MAEAEVVVTEAEVGMAKAEVVMEALAHRVAPMELEAMVDFAVVVLKKAEVFEPTIVSIAPDQGRPRHVRPTTIGHRVENALR